MVGRLMHKIFFKYINHPDIRFLIRDGKYKVCVQIVNITLLFCITWFLANYTSRDFFGEYKLFMAVIAFMFIFSFPGIKDSVIQSTARGYEYSFVYANKKSIKASIIGCGVIILISLYYLFIKKDIDVSIAFFICALFFPLFYSMDIVIAYLHGAQKFKEELVCSMWVTVIKVISLFLSVVFFKENIVVLVSAFLLSHIIAYTYFFNKYKKQVKDRRIDSELISYGQLMSKVAVLSTIGGKIDALLVGLFMNNVSLAIYSISIILPEKIRDIVKSLFSTFMPKFAAREMIATRKKIIILFFLGLVTSITLIFVFPVFIHFAFKRYDDAIRYGQMYSVALIFVYVNTYLGYLFRSARIEEAIHTPFLVSTVSYILFIILLTPFYGVIGLIVAIIMKQVISSVYLLSEYYKYETYLTSIPGGNPRT